MALEIDISGPAGNAFAILGMVRQYGRDLNWDQTDIDRVMTEMKSGDYDNLVDTFNREFEGIVELVFNDYE